MKYGVTTTIAAVITGVVLWAAVAPEFDTVKRFDDVKVTDVAIAIKVPVVKDGSVGPAVPDNLKALRKSQVVSYLYDEPQFATHAIVIMIVPVEHVGEFMSRASKHGSVEVMQKEDVVASAGEYSTATGILDKMEKQIEYALTPVALRAIQ